MKLEKAIELLTHWQKGEDITSFDDVNSATKLGIEAMKRLAICRCKGDLLDLTPLPGETE